MRCFKIFDQKDSLPCTLFHGINGSKTLPLDTWINAVVKDVSDGGPIYRSGFHVLLSMEETLKYIARFKHPRVIAEVDVDETAGTWPKAHSKDRVILAKRIRIRSCKWKKRVIT